MSKGSKFRSGTDLPTVAENIQTLTGQRGNGLDRAVTARELVDLGLASKRVGTGGQVSLIPGVTPPPGWGGPGANKPVQYPTRPTGFTAYGAFSFIALVWDMPKYGGHTLTEVYRNSEDNLANAVLVGTEAAGVYSDPQNTGQPGAYYWIRHVNSNGLPGPFNDSKGTFAQTDPNAAQNLIADRVVAGIEIITPLIRSARIENGRFTVDENGNMVATNASMNFMTANGGWFYDIYAERATFRNVLITEDSDVRGTIYANKLVGDVYNAQSGGIYIPPVTIPGEGGGNGRFSWSETKGDHVIWDIVGEEFDRVMDTNVTVRAGSHERQYFTLIIRSLGHNDIEIAFKDTGNDGGNGNLEYLLQGIRLPAVGRNNTQQLIMRVGEYRSGFVTIFTPVISGGGATGSPEVRAASVISVYRAGRKIATSGPA
ncbi:Fibronectin type III protein [Serratia fonticola]|uniref:DUF3672 domain-containing protein n=1 Tax=Serratia fonticola TaxID=47917 RepID=UPI002183662E|nr:DUF3672 domain-containing protein [Serratia fonticola]CAI2146072.1 Fibronectin type III protein [Serratia fonticola]